MTHEQISLLQELSNEIISWSETLDRHQGDFPANRLNLAYRTWRLEEVLVPMELNGQAEAAARLEKAVKELTDTTRAFDELCGRSDADFEEYQVARAEVKGCACRVESICRLILEGVQAANGSGIPDEAPVSEVPSDDATLSAKKLAELFNVDYHPLRKRLDRFRKNNLDCFIEAENRSSRGPTYFYYLGKVRPIIEQLKSKSASTERPPK